MDTKIVFGLDVWVQYVLNPDGINIGNAPVFNVMDYILNCIGVFVVLMHVPDVFLCVSWSCRVTDHNSSCFMTIRLSLY